MYKLKCCILTWNEFAQLLRGLIYVPVECPFRVIFTCTIVLYVNYMYMHAYFGMCMYMYM